MGRGRRRSASHPRPYRCFVRMLDTEPLAVGTDRAVGNFRHLSYSPLSRRDWITKPRVARVVRPVRTELPWGDRCKRVLP
jgi:hypothetical protein